MRKQCEFRNGRDEVHSVAWSVMTEESNSSAARAGLTAALGNKKEHVMTLPITSLLAGLFALLMVPLSLQVSLRRVKLGGVLAGDANDETLRRRIRAHGNFIEYAPTALVVVGLIEFGGGAMLLVAGLALAFFVSRALHAIGMLYASTPTLRASGMLIQHLAFLTAGVWLVYRAF